MDDMRTTRILLLPLDERPCNILFPGLNFYGNNEILLLTPPPNLLGRKKRPGNVEALGKWLEENLPTVDAAVVSLETLVYGGLVPSRLHHLGENIVRSRLDRLRRLKLRNPSVKLLLFGLVMRCPTYNSSDEEPDYWANYGEAIYRHGTIVDRRAQGIADKDELTELVRLKEQIPRAYLEDYTKRRASNLDILFKAIDGVGEGWVDILSIPQDDTALYGYSTMDRNAVLKRIQQNGLRDRIHIYPGADEAGCTLTARAYLMARGLSRSIAILPSHSDGLDVVPRYENQPIRESIAAHIAAAGGVLVDDHTRADVILALNLPVDATSEAPSTLDMAGADQKARRIIDGFVERMGELIAAGKNVAVADIRFTNGGDNYFVHRLAERRLVARISFYSGWNTCCNALGTVVSGCLVGQRSPKVLLYRLLEDWGYMAGVRNDLKAEDFPDIDDETAEAELRRAELSRRVKEGLEALKQCELKGAFDGVAFTYEPFFPWSRRFEVGFKVKELSFR